MKKFIVITIIIIVLLLLVIVAAYLVYMDKVDTIYAINYGKCFGGYSIGQVDRLLDDTTLITYNETTKTYSELKNNVKNAFRDRIFVMDKGSSYGSGNGFINGAQKVGIQSYVSVDGKDREVYVEMVLRKVGLRVRVESLNSTDEFFGYLFFRAPLKNGWSGRISGHSSKTVAGRTYNNSSQPYLPQVDANGNVITYREFDVNNYAINNSRNAERFIKGSDGSIYYTDTHYGARPSSPNGYSPFVKLK